MRELVRKLVLFSILISGTQVINLPFGNLSLFQISLIFTMLFGLVGVIMKGKIPIGKYLTFTIIYFISSILAWAISTNPTWAKSYLLLGLMTATMVFIITNYFGINDINLLERTIVRSQYIVFPFSLYSIIMFYQRGGLPNTVNLFAGLTIHLDNDTLLRGQASSQIRLMLPYSTPPVLSVAMAMCIIILLTNKSLFKSGIRRLLIVLYGLVLVFTASRTGIVGLGLVIIIFLFRNMQMKGHFKAGHILAGISGVLLLGVAFSLVKNSTFIVKMLRRFSNFNIMSDRHFLVPLDGIIIWGSSLRNFIIGIGLGSSLNIQGAHTYLPAYFLNSFITLLAERGLLGLIIIIILISLTRSLLKQSKAGLIIEGNDYCDSLGLSLLTGLLCCIFYEALNCYLLIFVIGISFMAEHESSLNKAIIPVEGK